MHALKHSLQAKKKIKESLDGSCTTSAIYGYKAINTEAVLYLRIRVLYGSSF